MDACGEFFLSDQGLFKVGVGGCLLPSHTKFRISSGLAVDFHEFLHDPYQPQGRDGTATLDAQPLLVAFIDDVERAKRPTVVERIAHEIQRPDLVERLHGLQGLGIARQHPFSGSARQVQLHVAVHAMNALVVPAVPWERSQ